MGHPFSCGYEHGWDVSSFPWSPNARDQGHPFFVRLANFLDGEAGVEAAGGGYAPGHGGGVVGEAEASVGAEEDDAAVSAEAIVEIADGFARGDLGG